jgi:hypothetical protein
MSSLEFSFTKGLFCDALRKFHITVCLLKKNKTKKAWHVKMKIKINKYKFIWIFNDFHKNHDCAGHFSHFCCQ